MRTGRGAAQWARVCYGLDVGDDGVRAVRAERARAELRFTPLAAGDTSYRDASRGAGTVAAGFLGVRECIVRRLHSPLRSAGKALKVLPSLLDIELPFPVEECLYTALELAPHPAGGMEALALAARRRDIARRLEAHAPLGVNPEVLDCEGVALWTQSLREWPAAGDGDPARAVVYVGASRATLALGRGDRFVSAHAVGGKSADDILRLLRVQLEPPAAAIEWAWAGPACGTAAQPCELARMLASRLPGASRWHEDPAYFLARALAARALTAGPLRCNLRAEEFTHAGLAARGERERRRAAAVCLCAALLVCAVNAAWGAAAARRDADLARACDRLAAGLAGRPVTARGEHALAVVRRALDDRAAQAAPLLAALKPSLTGALALVVGAAGEGGIQLDTVSVRAEAVGVSGEAQDDEACARLIARLEAAGYEVQPTRRESNEGQNVAFTLAATPHK